MQWLTYVPDSARQFFLNVAGIFRFSAKFFRNAFRPPYELREVFNQVYQLGYSSLLLVSVTAFIIGMVMTLQMEPTMEQFGAESWLPSMISLSIVREIGPVITALICAGKVGSGIGAELGSMKVTEQIDAMTLSGASAFNYLVVTRVIATTLTVPILVYYADAVAIAGSFLGANLETSLSLQIFYTKALNIIAFSDLVPATIKTFFFGFAIGIVGCYKGFNAGRDTTSVGEAANSAVVISSLFIFLIDLFAVQITQIFI